MTASYSALLTSVSVYGSLWKFAIPPTIAARWMTCEQPSVAARASFSSRRSPVWISQPSRIHCGGSRWSETRTSQAGSPSRRRTTAAPIVPAPPVTSTRFMRRLRLARGRHYTRRDADPWPLQAPPAPRRAAVVRGTGAPDRPRRAPPSSRGLRRRATPADPQERAGPQRDVQHRLGDDHDRGERVLRPRRLRAHRDARHHEGGRRPQPLLPPPR